MSTAPSLETPSQPTPPIQPPVQPLVQLENLTKHFPIKKGLLGRTVGEVKAVSNVNLSIYPGETLGLVGESGCGKSTLGRSILQLIRPSSGAVHFTPTDKTVDLTKLSNHKLRPLRREMQIIFQNPYSSLDPRMKIGDTLAEPFQIHKTLKGAALTKRVKELLDVVGLPQDALHRYPHEFSGGQRQRIGIARALALNPKFIVADEPVSALDVSIQAQILNLLDDLKREWNLTYLFIAHNLSVVEYISDRVAVMYLGQIVEIAPRESFYRRPLHPYTQALLAAIPIPDPILAQQRSKTHLLEGDPPNPANPPTGCRFHTRCPYAEERCRVEVPVMTEYFPSHSAACHLIPQLQHLQPLAVPAV